MNVVAWILGIILAGVFSVAGLAKVFDVDRTREHFGHTRSTYRLIGLAEVAAVVGVIIGLVSRKLEWIALAAATGLCCLMMGALMAHAKAGDDAKKILPAVIVFALSIAFMIFISLR